LSKKSQSMQGHQTIQVTLSDMDGTLLDTEAIYESVHQAYMSKYNIQIPQRDLDLLRGTGAKNFHELLSKKSAQFVVDNPCHIDFSKQRITEYYNVLAAQPDLVVEIKPVLDKFKALVTNNEAALIVTNSSFETVEHTMAAASLKDVFWKNAIASDYVMNQGYDVKPSGDPYLLGLDRVNQTHNAQHSPLNCVVLEDSIVGVRSGLDFGGHIVHVITDVSQALSEADVSQMRADSSYLKAHANNAFAQSHGLSYTACKPQDFEAVYDALVADSQKGAPLPRYNNLA
jgi:beta-phosphoglucomutase-like phosphatase (HAD superfamily)